MNIDVNGVLLVLFIVFYAVDLYFTVRVFKQNKARFERYRKKMEKEIERQKDIIKKCNEENLMGEK